MSAPINSDIRIRPVDNSCIGDLLRIAEETGLSPWSAQNYIDELKNPDAILLRLCDQNNETLGFIAGRQVIGGEVAIRADAEIYNVAVSPFFHGLGYGQALFDAFTAECRDRNVVYVWLEVRESNTKAIDFYLKNGFQKVQTRSSFYENPREHAILMKAQIGRNREDNAAC